MHHSSVQKKTISDLAGQLERFSQREVYNLTGMILKFVVECGEFIYELIGVMAVSGGHYFTNPQSWRGFIMFNNVVLSCVA